MRRCFFTISFLIFFVKSIAAGDIGFVEFREKLYQNDPEDLKKAYRQLETCFFSHSATVSLLDWSTFVELTKKYSSFCLKCGDSEEASKALVSLLSKKPPEVFVADLSFVLQGLNPGRDSRAIVMSKLRNLIRHNPDYVLSLEQRLLMSTYETLNSDCFEEYYRRINTEFHLQNYSRMRDACAEAINKVSSEDGFPEDIAGLIVADLERLQCKAELYEGVGGNSDNFSKEKIKKINAYLRSCSLYLKREDDFLERLHYEKSLRNIYADMMLLKSGKRHLAIDFGQGISILESLIDGGRYIRSAPNREALLCLLNTYFTRDDSANVERLVSLTEERLCIGDPLIGDLTFYRGWLAYKTGCFSEALNQFEKLLKHQDTIGEYMHSLLLISGEIFLRRAFEDIKLGKDAYFDLAQAERCFLSAYKNWNKGKGALGYVLTLILQKGTLGKDACRFADQFIKENFHSLTYLEKSLCRSIVELFLPDSRDDFSGIGPFFSREVGLYRLMSIHKESVVDDRTVEKEILKFLCKKPFYIADSLTVVFQEIINWKLASVLATYAGKPESIWSLVYRIQEKLVFGEQLQGEILSSTASNELKEALLIQFSLLEFGEGSNRNNTGSRYISEFSGYSLVNSDCDVSSIKDCNLTEADYRRLGEEFYFKMYSCSAYLNGKDIEARNHLKHFEDLFPHSELLPVVVFLIGSGEERRDYALDYLAYSLSLFDTVSLNPHKNEAYAYFYYRTCFEYAGRLLESCSLEDTYRAVQVLEDLNEKNKAGFFGISKDGFIAESYDNSKTLIQLLITGYATLFEQDYVSNHVFENLDRIATDRDLLEWVPGVLDQLSEKLSTTS